MRLDMFCTAFSCWSIVYNFESRLMVALNGRVTALVLRVGCDIDYSAGSSGRFTRGGFDFLFFLPKRRLPISMFIDVEGHGLHRRMIYQGVRGFIRYV